MVDERTESLGAYLRRNREEHGITLEQIEAVTKINLRYLREIEAERFENLPAPIFTLGFVKQYAQCIGLEPEDVAYRYRLAVHHEGGGDTEGVPKQQSLLTNRMFWIVVGAFVGLVLLWILLSPGGKNAGPRVRSVRHPGTSTHDMKKDDLRKSLDIDGTSPSDVAAGNSAVEGVAGGAVQGGADPGAAAAEDRVAITIRGMRKTRIKVVLDGGDPQERTMRGGEVVSYEAKDKIDLEVQHGNAVRIYYGAEEPLGDEWGKDEQVRIQFPLPPS